MVYRDPTPIDTNKEYTAEELSQFILEKMYGRDTRTAMALSLLKANEVAEWAREVAQQLIDGSFDEGVLNTEIEHKLNELEQQYAPELNGVKNQLEQTTAELNEKIDSTIPENAFELPKPWYFAHRGAMNLYQEHTLLAYENCVARGNRFLEIDVQQTSDGSLVVMHDSTMDRTTNGNWTIGTLSTNYISTKEVIDKVGESKEFGYVPQPIPFLSNVFSKFGRKANYIIESKDRKSATKILKMADDMKLKDFVMIASFDLNDLLTVADKGVRLMYLSNNINAEDIETLINNKIEYVACNKNNSDTYIESLVNAGLKTFIYTVNNRYERDEFLNLGVSGLISDDPFYLEGNIPILSNDRYREKVFMDGMVPNESSQRGGFPPSLYPYRWGFYESRNDDGDAEGRDFVLQGWLGELPEQFTLEFEMTFEEDFVDDLGEWGSVAICTPIDYYYDTFSQNSSGYHILFAKTGNISIFRTDNGLGQAIARGIGQDLNEPITVPLRIEVTKTHITVTRTDTNLSATVEDSTYRGGYLHFGRRNSKVTFSKVTLTR